MRWFADNGLVIACVNAEFAVEHWTADTFSSKEFAVFMNNGKEVVATVEGLGFMWSWSWFQFVLVSFLVHLV